MVLLSGGVQAQQPISGSAFGGSSMASPLMSISPLLGPLVAAAVSAMTPRGTSTFGSPPPVNFMPQTPREVPTGGMSPPVVPIYNDINIHEAPIPRGSGAANILSNLLNGAGTGGPFIPPNYPNMPNGSTPTVQNLPGFSMPALPSGAGAPYQMPQAPGGASPTAPAMDIGANRFQPAPWTQLPGDTGGGGRPPLQGINTVNELRQPTHGGTKVPAPPPSPSMVPPPPPYAVPPALAAALAKMPTMPSEPQSPFLPAPGAVAKAKAPASAGVAMTPKTDPAGEVPPPPPEAQKSVQEKVRENFGALTPGRDPYSNKPEDITKKFADDLQQQIKEIDERYAGEIDSARMARHRAVVEGNRYLHMLQSLPSNDQLQIKAVQAANRMANAQEQDYRGLGAGGWLSQLASGRVPDRMVGRNARVAALAGSYMDSFVKNRDKEAELIKQGLDWATAQLKEADGALNHVMQRRNQEVQIASTMARGMAMNQTNYARGMGAYDQGNIRNNIAATDSQMRHDDRQQQNQLRREMFQQKMQLANQQLAIQAQNANTMADRVRAYSDYVRTMTQNMPMRTDAERARALAQVYQAAAFITNPEQKQGVIDTAGALLGIDGGDDGAVAQGGVQQ